jgi:hypothetical protein
MQFMCEKVSINKSMTTFDRNQPKDLDRKNHARFTFANKNLSLDVKELKPSRLGTPSEM